MNIPVRIIFEQDEVSRYRDAVLLKIYELCSRDECPTMGEAIADTALLFCDGDPHHPHYLNHLRRIGNLGITQSLETDGLIRRYPGEDISLRLNENIDGRVFRSKRMGRARTRLTTTERGMNYLKERKIIQ